MPYIKLSVDNVQTFKSPMFEVFTEEINQDTISNIFNYYRNFDLTSFFEEGSVNVLQNYIKDLCRSVKAQSTMFNGIGAPNVNLENTDSRTISSTVSTASETQPINSAIEDIDSPTTKGKSVATTTDKNVNVNVSDGIKSRDYLMNEFSRYEFFKSLILKFFQETNCIY